ncbi:MAG TPA: signal peptidase II [Stellaceae bacterium]|nr:signal peptidase II [Stellaceae bacterium]
MLMRGLATAALVALLDQLSKLAVLGFFAAHAAGYRLVEITSFFDLVLTYNHGMSFGLFDHGSAINAVLFSAVAAAIVAILIWWLRRAAHPLLAVAIGLIIGGALGNVIDRLRLGGVVDFLYFHAGPWYWPAFNLADTAICLGVAAMLLDGLLLHRQAH